MEGEYYISMYHHRHGTDADVISGKPEDHWGMYEPDSEEEFFTDAALPALFAAAPEMLAALASIRSSLMELDDDGCGRDDAGCGRPGCGWREMDATYVDQLISNSLRLAIDAIAKAEGRE